MVFVSGICLFSASSIDFITSTKSIKDPDTLSSGDFKLGFFSPVNSTNRYVGIWYLNESNVVWVANRNKPLGDSSGVVTLSNDGNLVVLNGHNLTLWSSDVSNITTSPTTIAKAQLLDTGNLVLQVRDNYSTGMSMTVWESFQHPSDSWLPKMKLGFNPIITGKNIKVTAWKSHSDPSIGTFSAGIGRPDPPQLFTWNGSRPYGRTVPFQRHLYIGLNGLSASSSFIDFGMSTLQNEQDGTISLSFELLNKYDFAVFKLDSTGKWFVSMWRNQTKFWLWSSKNGEDECELYGRCGKFASSDSNSSAICTCLSGFEPRNLEEWNRNNWSSGCVRKAPLQCDEDGFKKVQTVKVPDFAERSNVREVECRTQCLRNCSCVAYAYDSNIGCMTWSGDLIDIVKPNTSRGVDLNIRLSSSEFGSLFFYSLIFGYLN